MFHLYVSCNHINILFLRDLDDNQLPSLFIKKIVSCFGSDCIRNNNNSVSFSIQYNADSNGFDSSASASATSAVKDMLMLTNTLQHHMYATTMASKLTIMKIVSIIITLVTVQRSLILTIILI